MTNKEIDDLWKRYAEGTCTPAEKALMDAAFLKYVDEDEIVPDEFLLLDAQERLENTFQAITQTQKPTRKTNWLLYIAATAAAIIILLSIWTILFVKIPLPENFANDVDPGGNKATLTFANGQKVNLSDAKNGVVIDATKITYSDNTPIASGQENNIGINTITTPRGGTYQITLPDGTKVWLNSNSSLAFPASFTGSKKRIITLNGEGYFEVSKNTAQPFTVKSKGQEIEVLGTHFNVSCYAEESTIKTTLLEGSVRVSSSRADAKKLSITLSPNQQAVNDGNIIIIHPVEAMEIIAWKNGEFAFRKEPLESIMLKISRWYNVEVVFEDTADKQLLFGGTISRYAKLSEVLCNLERTGDVKFKIEGRRISVLK